MENEEIIGLLELTGKLLELHDENPFKVRGYQTAAFQLDKITVRVADLSLAELEKLDGIGKSMADKIDQIIHLNTFKELDEVLAKTPKGVLDIMKIKGLGPKKVKTLWKELGIETKEELLKACQNNTIAQTKGFGEKTQASILENLLFLASQKDKWFYATAENVTAIVLPSLQDFFGKENVHVVGQIATKEEVVDGLEFLVQTDAIPISKNIAELSILHPLPDQCHPWKWAGVVEPLGIPLYIHFSLPSSFTHQKFVRSSSEKHLQFFGNQPYSMYQFSKENPNLTEEEVYAHFNLPFLPSETRVGGWELQASTEKINQLVTIQDLKGTIHNHSTFSDGKHTLEEMAQAAISLGYEYLGISDHSQSAFYANGLYPEKIDQQHREIDALNQKLAPFKIFKGIESDILNDGSLDYVEKDLAKFDFIVASVHSNLSMDETKATARLLKAIENPYTTMLGHPTGRLLLKRKGYPIDHKTIIDACAHHGVIIEINANPWRLDLDWRWVDYALQKQVMISINPDAHETKGYGDMAYGVYVGRKGGLTKNMTFNALSRKEVEAYFNKRKPK